MSLRRAVELLWRGYAAHPGNRSLRDRVRSGELGTELLYRELQCAAVRAGLEALLRARGLRSRTWPWRSFVASSAAAPELDLCELSEGDRRAAADALAGHDVESIARDYEHALALRARVDRRSLALRLDAERASRRKSQGAYTTAAREVVLVVERVIPRTASDVRVCDPACGSGTFLAAAAERIASRGEPLRDAIERRVHGADVDPVAVELAKARLWFLAGAPDRDGDWLEDRIVHADALVARPDGLPTPRWSGAFDVVIGNPPWISYAGRQRPRGTRAYAELLVAAHPALAAWPAAHTAFLLETLRLLRAGGRFGLVLPLSVAHLERYRAVREVVDRAIDELEVVDCGEAAFAGVVQPCGVYFGRVHARRNGAHGDHREHGQRGGAWVARCATRTGESGRGRRLDLLLRELALRPRFPASAFSDPGVHSGNVAERIIAPIDSARGDSARRESARGAEWAPLREGKDVAAYACFSARKVVHTAPALASGEYCRVPPHERLAGFPILIRQTADRPIAARHVTPGHFRNSLLGCRGVPRVPLEVMLAILNSALLAAWHRATVVDAAQRAFPQVKVAHLRALPGFDPERLERDSDLAARIVRAVRAVERAKAIEHAIATERAATVSDERAQGLRFEVERMVAELYALPPDAAALAWEAEIERARRAKHATANARS